VVINSAFLLRSFVLHSFVFSQTDSELWAQTEGALAWAQDFLVGVSTVGTGAPPPPRPKVKSLAALRERHASRSSSSSSGSSSDCSQGATENGGSSGAGANSADEAVQGAEGVEEVEGVDAEEESRMFAGMINTALDLAMEAGAVVLGHHLTPKGFVRKGR
jgi:hypothetical protein